MNLFTAPEEVKLTSGVPIIFLGGSIEMGSASEWQLELIERLKNEDCIILNPRRKEWDSSWVQSKNNPKFVEQVNWELDGVEMSDIVLICLEPDTKAPVSLLEFGLCVTQQHQEVMVYCPEGYWRKGNVDIVAERYDARLFEDKEALIKKLIETIRFLKNPPIE